jgi:hypothetical protein
MVLEREALVTSRTGEPENQEQARGMEQISRAACKSKAPPRLLPPDRN